jgi:hypothetical protein
MTPVHFRVYESARNIGRDGKETQPGLTNEIVPTLPLDPIEIDPLQS